MTKSKEEKKINEFIKKNGQITIPEIRKKFQKEGLEILNYFEKKNIDPEESILLLIALAYTLNNALEKVDSILDEE